MSDLKQRKFNKIMDHRDAIASEGGRGISSLNSAVDKAVEFSIFLEEDPGSYFASNGDKEEIREDFSVVLSSLNEILPKIELIRQLKDEEITVEQFRVALNKQAFDSSVYQASLGG